MLIVITSFFEELVILIADTLFIQESRKTAQQVIFQDDLICTVRLYFGREISFSLDQIDVIKPYKVGWMHRLMTILVLNLENYLVSMHKDSLFISGAMPQANEHITLILEYKKVEN